MEKIGKYEISEMLGKGAMGIVYKALDPDIGREVAIKTIRFDLSSSAEQEELMGRFVREAQAAGKIHHANIVTIYEVGREKDLTYIVMQYIKGKSLQQLIAEKKKYSPKEISEIMIPLCDALDYAHRHGVVHRDIKPANILIDEEGKPYIVDFGVARVETSTLTQTGTTVGTPSYMSPEQIMGKRVDNRADIFSLGVILYELATGQRPFSGENISTIMYKIVNEEPPHVTDVERSLPNAYEKIIEKAMAKDPDDRFSSCAQFADFLKGDFLNDEATIAYKTERPKPGFEGKPKRKKVGLVLGLSFLLVIVVAAVGGYFLFIKPGSFSNNPSQKISEQTVVSNPQSIDPAIPPENKTTLPDSITQKIEEMKAVFEEGDWQGAIKLADEILAEEADNSTALDYKSQAQENIDTAAISKWLKNGINFYSQKNYSQAVSEMQKILAKRRNHPEALRYLQLSRNAIEEPRIRSLIERQRAAEESKDLLILLNDIGTQDFSDKRRAEATFVFNNFERIKSVYSNIEVEVQSPNSARATFSYLLTGVNSTTKRDGTIEQGVKTWLFEKQGNVWKIVGQQ
jgi:serine/threonine protein kinase